MISRGGLKRQKRNKNQSLLVTSCLIVRLYEIWRKETNQICSSISIYIYKAFLLRQLKFIDIHVIKKRIKSSPRLFLFFQNQSKSEKKKKMTPRDQGSAATLSYRRRRGLKFRKGICVSKSLRVAYCLLIGSNIFSRGEF